MPGVVLDRRTDIGYGPGVPESYRSRTVHAPLWLPGWSEEMELPDRRLEVVARLFACGHGPAAVSRKTGWKARRVGYYLRGKSALCNAVQRRRNWLMKTRVRDLPSIEDLLIEIHQGARDAAEAGEHKAALDGRKFLVSEVRRLDREDGMSMLTTGEPVDTVEKAALILGDGDPPETVGAAIEASVPEQEQRQEAWVENGERDGRGCD